MGIRQVVKGITPAPLLPTAQRINESLARLRRGTGSPGAAFVTSTLDAQLAYNRFGGYLVPNSSAHRPAAQLVLNHEVYEADTIEFIRDRCGDGDIVHAGAYFGDFLPALSAGCASGAVVWAFEPNEENCRCAGVTASINNLHNVRLHHAGLGERSEDAFIRIKDEHGRGLGGASSVVSPPDHRADLDQTVAMVAIDRVVPRRRRVSIIQLDVEGHEQAVLAGALATIRRWRPIIIVEVLPGSDLLGSSWFATNIGGLGYEQTHQVDGNVVFTAPDRPPRVGRIERHVGARRRQA